MYIYTHPDSKMLAVRQQIRSDSHYKSICVRICVSSRSVDNADMLC